MWQAASRLSHKRREILIRMTLVDGEEAEGRGRREGGREGGRERGL